MVSSEATRLPMDVSTNVPGSACRSTTLTSSRCTTSVDPVVNRPKLPANRVTVASICHNMGYRL